MVENGIAIAQRIKVTPGITGLSPPRVHIDGEVWHLDVGSSHPGAEAGSKGWAVRPLKRHASWVQNVVRQFGPSSRAALMGEQPNPWNLLQLQDATSRHRGAKPPRRCELLGEISLLSPG